MAIDPTTMWKFFRLKFSECMVQCVSNMMTSILTRNFPKVKSTPSLRGRFIGVELTFREFLVRMCVIIFETHYTRKNQESNGHGVVNKWNVEQKKSWTMCRRIDDSCKN